MPSGWLYARDSRARRTEAMNEFAVDLDCADEDIAFHDEVSDEALEAAGSTMDALAGIASQPFTYLGGMCC